MRQYLTGVASVIGLELLAVFIWLEVQNPGWITTAVRVILWYFFSIGSQPR